MASTAPPPTVLVTGASSGIGRATALAFAARGSRLVLTARGGDALQEAALECRKAGAAAVLAQPADIGERSEVTELFDSAITEFGRLDVVVQNAAVAAFGKFADVPTDIFDAVIRINVIGAANVARSALRHFQDHGQGQLVVVSSVLGQVGVPFMGPYVMSKFALTGLIRMLRQETRDTAGIVIHGIYPGAVDTTVYAVAANYFGRRARVLPLSDSPAKVARTVVRATESGRPSERQVGVANYPMLLASRTVPRLFDVAVAPLMRLGSFARQQLPATPGNVLKQTRPAGIRNTNGNNRIS
jgi:NAD(P)-dependent dehydrogenase (short-subunit alcohol dehydrogenase family)